ncbi:mucin-5B-like [Xenopus tropicalis]|uniref:Mucin-5B-like n=1 Tax=Xenopus tropicalis TaxID=8364 RepID=A0A8J1JH22_XENTR|nr:mucin-5B-like [Xenopus tropicalis]
MDLCRCKATMLSNGQEFQKGAKDIQSKVSEKCISLWYWLELPYSQSGIQIEQRGKELRITAKMMLSLIWEDDSSLHLILNKKYMGQTCGLCADYDGDQNNDLVYKDSLLQPIEYGTLHKLRKPEQNCVDPKPESKERCFVFRALCLNLLTNYKWKRCNRLVDPDPYVEAYMHDMCICNSSVKYSSFCLCSTIAEYSRQCAIAGGKPPDWRSPEMCYLQCPYNLVYKECSSPCAPTCSNPGRQFFCDGTCVAGCVCPTGLVLDDITNSGCVPLKNCSCIFNNDVYPPGSYYHAPCSTCLCTGSHWTCENLPCPSSCSVEGGSHITTFDKARYTFNGKCIYMLAKSCADNAFLVNIEMQKCAYAETATCLKRVFLFLDRGKAIFEIKYDKSDFPHVEFDEKEMAEAGVQIFWPSSFYMIVQTNKGLYLQVQLTPIMQLYVILDPSYKKKTCGLCGNFNDIQKDDFRSSSGAVEANVVDFANTWKAQYSCTNVKPVPEHPCSYGMEIVCTPPMVYFDCEKDGDKGSECPNTCHTLNAQCGNKLILSDGNWEVEQTFSEIDIAYKVRNMGLFLVVETTNGLVIKWDRMTSIYIYLSISFKGKVCGLCGNFDGNINNDFTTRSKCVVEDATEFRDSWKVSPTCPEVYISKDPCSINPHRVSWAQKLCMVINSDVFSKCHSEVDPEKYYEACIRDTCACDIGGDCNCYCTAIAAYAQACSEACVCVDWRTPTLCPLFCDFYNKEGQCEWSYMPCGAPCMKTCRNPSGTCVHHLKGLEGCYPKCPENKPFFNEDEMLCVANCGCLDTDDNYYKLGEKVESCNICESWYSFQSVILI